MVLFDHFGHAFLGGYRGNWTQTGAHGVTIFFILSGYLITSRLIAEKIDLGKFYVRRFFRLMPAAWAYLAFLLALDRISHLPFISGPTLVSCLLFLQNFNLNPDAATIHYWSLSLEEQFYLVWPCILLLAGARKSRWIACLSACAIALYRWTHWDAYNRFLVNTQSQVRGDALLVVLTCTLLKRSCQFVVLV